MNTDNIAEIVNFLLSKTGKLCFVYAVDSKVLTYINSTFESIWHRTVASVKAEPGILSDTLHPGDKEMVFRKYERLLEGIILREVEFRIVLPDQQVRWVSLSPQLITDDTGRRLIAGIAEDVTSIKENNNTLYKYAAKKDSVLEILSHELAGSVGIVQSLSGLLAETVQEYKNEEADKIIRIIHKSSSDSLQLIRDFVQQEFLESANAALVKERIDLVTRLQDIVEQYREGEAFIKKEIRFQVKGDPIFAWIDDNKFMQVINNLISNSIKFTHDGGIISLVVEEKEETVLITVQDNGIGIPEEYQDELFDKFTRARREGLKGEPSTGLGMSLIRTIVEWHQGRIWFESKTNAGTTFYIEIPKS